MPNPQAGQEAVAEDFQTLDWLGFVSTDPANVDLPAAGEFKFFHNLSSGKFASKDSNGDISVLGSDGESNTASNRGAGIGVFDQKVGVDLQLRSLVAASTRISISLDAPNQEIDFDVVEANMLLQNLGGQATAGQVPNLENLNGTLDIGSGGTGQATAAAAFNALSPLTTLGDVLYRDGSNNVRLAGNTSTTKQFLTQTGDGINSAAPAWGTIASGDLPSHTHDASTDLTNLFYQTVEDEGVAVTQRTNINFVGAGVTVSDVGGKTEVSITGATAGSDKQVQFNDGGSAFGADSAFTFNKTSDLLTLSSAVDGNYEALHLVNSQAPAAASVNETVELRFGFGTNLDVARIQAGKVNDYTIAANEDSYLAFLTEDGGIPAEKVRIDNKGVLGIGPNPGTLVDDAIDIGTRGTGNNVASKRIRFRSRDSGGTDENWTIDTDTDGNARFLMNTNNNLFSFGGTAVNVLQILPTAGADVVRVRDGQLLITRDISTGFNGIKITNENEALNTTKYVAVKYQGEDSIGATKDVGSARMSPSDGNWVGSRFDVLVRTSDAVATEFSVGGSNKVWVRDNPVSFDEMTTTPANPTSGAQCRVYMKADKLIFQYNDAGTVRYKYLDLTGTGVTWVHTTTAP